jgi:hypothetical protein
MDERNAADYNLVSLDYESASRHLANAAQFLNRIEPLVFPNWEDQKKD